MSFLTKLFGILHMNTYYSIVPPISPLKLINGRAKCIYYIHTVCVQVTLDDLSLDH